jgi:hypothetical protein
VEPSIEGLVMNAITATILVYLAVTSGVWMFKHRRNGWAYSTLPLIVGVCGLVFISMSVYNKFYHTLDPVFLNNVSQMLRILTLSSYVISIQIHLRCLKICGLV